MKSLKNVINLYNKNFYHQQEYKKVIWGSHIGMVNRYKLFFKLIKNKNYYNWLDIGCGTGIIFNYHEKTNIKINNRYGIEVNKKLFLFAKSKNYKQNVFLRNKNILKFSTKKKFDLISLIGVLQNSGYHYLRLLKKIKKVMNKNSFIYITSKNLLYKKLNKKYLQKSNHQWFNPYEVEKFLNKNKIKTLIIGGFNSTTNRIVDLKNSSTFFIYGKNIK